MENFEKLKIPNDFIQTSDKNSLYLRSFEISFLYLEDVVPLVNQVTCELIQQLIVILERNPKYSSEVKSMSQQFLPQIILKTQDFKDSTQMSPFEQILLKMLSQDLLSLDLIIAKMINPQMGKVKLNNKHLIGRANFLCKVCMNFQSQRWEKQLIDILNFGIDNLNHQKKEVRMAFHQMIVIAYKFSNKNKIKSHLEASKVRKPILDLLMNDFEEIDSQVVEQPIEQVQKAPKANP